MKPKLKRHISVYKSAYPKQIFLWKLTNTNSKDKGRGSQKRKSSDLWLHHCHYTRHDQSPGVDVDRGHPSENIKSIQALLRVYLNELSLHLDFKNVCVILI